AAPMLTCIERSDDPRQLDGLSQRRTPTEVVHVLGRDRVGVRHRHLDHHRVPQWFVIALPLELSEDTFLLRASFMHLDPQLEDGTWDLFGWHLYDKDPPLRGSVAAAT